MEDTEILEILFELARDAGFELSVAGRDARSGGAATEWPSLPSGVCRVRGALWVVLSSEEPVHAQIEVLCAALRQHAGEMLENRHLPPAVRERIGPGGEPDPTPDTVSDTTPDPTAA